MAFACASRGALGTLHRDAFAFAGAPPEKEVWPEPRERGATVAAVVRILRMALAPVRGSAHRGLKPELQGR